MVSNWQIEFKTADKIILNPYPPKHKRQMISEKIKAVFEFVDFLHSNTKVFKEYVPIVDECWNISDEMARVNPHNSFQERKKYNELNQVKNQKFNLVKTNVIDVIKSKARNLNICQETNSGLEFNWGYSEIHELKEQATDNDAQTIIEHKNHYLEFRNETNSYFLSFQYFFFGLDRYLKEIFVYFDKNAESDFVRLEPKGISSEPALSKDELENISKSLSPVIFFEVRNIENKKYDTEIETNRPTSLNLENWNNLKNEFIKQRFQNENYNNLTENETSQFELMELEHLEKYVESNESKLTPENKKTYTILIMRYREVLQTIQNSKSEQTKDELFDEGSTENNYVLSNIEDWLYPFKEENILIKENYTNLVNALLNYFNKGFFSDKAFAINVGKVNVKRFGWALNEIFKANNNSNEKLSIEYLRFAKEKISIFKDVSFDETNYLKSNLYKYFTTKTN